MASYGLIYRANVLFGKQELCRPTNRARLFSSCRPVGKSISWPPATTSATTGAAATKFLRNALFQVFSSDEKGRSLFFVVLLRKERKEGERMKVG